MRCSKKNNCEFSCSGKNIPQKFSALIGIGLVQAMDENKLPIELASRISDLLEQNLDAADFCDYVIGQQRHAKTPKARLLDRAIVNRFEHFYEQLNSELNKRSSSKINMGCFFDAIPRGECLDIFLALIKSHCIGDNQLEKFNRKLTLLTKDYSEGDEINWQDVYQSDEYQHYMDSFFTLVFERINDGETPIPALNNKLDEKHQPERINKILKYMSKVWQLEGS